MTTGSIGSVVFCCRWHDFLVNGKKFYAGIGMDCVY
jgi:hypothetical protein